MKNYCYICLLTACMAPMSLQAQKAIPYSGDVCVPLSLQSPQPFPAYLPTRMPGALPTLRCSAFPKLISWIMANGSFSGIHKE